MIAAQAPGGALPRSRVLTWVLKKYRKDGKQQQQQCTNLIFSSLTIVQLGLWSQGRDHHALPWEKTPSTQLQNSV